MRQYLSTLRQHWLLIALLVVLGLGAGYSRYSVTPRLFKATAVVIIERQTLSAQVSGIEPWLQSAWNVEYYPTQYRLLRSRGLAEKVVRQLGLDKDPRFRSATSEGGSEDPSTVLAKLANRLLDGLVVDPISKTQMVEIEYRSPDAEFAAVVANQFASQFIFWGLEDRRIVADSATKFLGRQIDELKGQIEQTDRELKRREAEDSLLSGEGEMGASATQLASLTVSYSAAMNKRIERESRYSALLSAPPETVADRGASERLSGLRRAQAERERDYASQLKVYKPDWPGMVELKAEIESAAVDLEMAISDAVTESRQSANSDFQAALREEEQLLKEIGRLRGEALESSSQTVELANLRRELENRQVQLEGVLERQSRTEVQSRLQAQGESNVRIIDRAIVPSSPFQPDLRASLSAGFGGGLLLGVVLAFLINFFDNTIKTAEEAERMLGLPTLGVVADLEGGGRRYGYYGYSGNYGRARAQEAKTAASVEIELVPSKNPRLAVSESYRSLRTALLLSSAEELCAVAVTSASAGEGKSSTAVNLACVLAQLGRKVLLIDGDLRKPRQHQILAVSNRVGLVSCLTGNAKPADVVQSTEIDNLFVTTAGPVAPNPSELLGSERMKDVLEYYESAFDFLVIDTPPILAVSDGVLLGSASQGVVFCIRGGSTVREDAKSALERLRLSEVRVLGTVLNRYHHRPGAYRGQRYYQYYPYERAEEADSAA